MLQNIEKCIDQYCTYGIESRSKLHWFLLDYIDFSITIRLLPIELPLDLT
jgi:hypothetical protein